MTFATSATHCATTLRTTYRIACGTIDINRLLNTEPISFQSQSLHGAGMRRIDLDSNSRMVPLGNFGSQSKLSEIDYCYTRLIYYANKAQHMLG